ncbi:MAG: diaminopimelate dehydrogenase, partial [Clostridiales bacterium]|nr:diaminopimelate dehydrogenase [Clostridiales bacterium]
MGIKIGIVGYGNLGKGVEKAITQNPDMELTAVFSRRDPGTICPILSTTKVCKTEKMDEYKNEIDVMILC